LKNHAEGHIQHFGVNIHKFWGEGS